MTADTDETRVVVVRHGETEWNREGRIQGWAPTPLNARGREQARDLGAHLAGAYEFDRLIASDLRRTRETAALIREGGVGPTPTFDRAWRERSFGVYQGLDRETLFGTHPQFDADCGVWALREQPEGGESLLDVRERVLDAWEGLCEMAAGETVLVVTHGGPVYVLLGHLKGQNLVDAVTDHSQHNCAVNEVVVGESVTVRRENELVSR